MGGSTVDLSSLLLDKALCNGFTPARWVPVRITWDDWIEWGE